jgi:hypothetical protein
VAFGLAASCGGARGGSEVPWGAENCGGEVAPAASSQAAVADGVVASARGGRKQRLGTTAAPDNGFKAGAATCLCHQGVLAITAAYGAM